MSCADRESGPVVVGRERELDQLRSVLAATTGGSFRAVVVEGEPGIGKSSLVGRLVRDARETGVQVLVGTARELERNRPFGVVFELARHEVESAPDRDSAVFRNVLKLGTRGGTRSGDGGFLVTEELVNALATIATRWPVLLCLEDLHWADVSTLSAVGTVVRRLADLPLAVLVTLRPAPRPAEVERLLEQLYAAGAALLRLPPLADDATTRMACAILGAPPGPLLREQIGAAAGNPLFVVELIRALQQQHLISVADGRAEVPRCLVPPSLRQTLLRRYSFLSVDTIGSLRMASILGPAFSVAELAAVCESRASRLVHALHEATSAGLIEETGEHMAFRHDLFRQALYEDMPAGLRTALHREAGAILAAEGADAIRVAEQLVLGDPAGEHTVEWLWRAARESAAHSASLAVRWYERALDAVRPDDPRWGSMTAELVPHLVLLGRLADAQDLAARAIRHADRPAVAARLRVILAHALTRQGLWTAARAQLDVAAAEYDDPAAAAVALAPASFLRLIVGDVAGAVAVAKRSGAAARAAGNQLAVATCLMTRTLGASAVGATQDAIELGLQGMAASERSHTSFRGFLLPELCLGVAYADADRFTEAEHSYRAGFDRAARLGTASILPYLQANRAILRLHTGAWDDAGSEAEACLELASSTGTRWRTHALAVLVRLAISHHRFDRAARLLAEAEADLLVSGPIMGANWVLWTKALLREAEGRPAEAAEAAGSAWATCPGLRFLHTNWMYPVDVLRLVLLGRDDGTAHAIVEETEAAAARTGTASAAGGALRCRALVDADPDVAVAAVSAYQDARRPVERALAQAQAAVALADAGRVDDARPHFRAAVDTFDALDLRYEENGLRSAMRRHGIRWRRPRPRRPTTGWHALTPTEQQVAELVAQGLTNPDIAARLFVSRYTVEGHLKQVFAKLGITSRVALVNEVVREHAPR
jgi:DNA-binding NarL/FixJ family response regulator